MTFTTPGWTRGVAENQFLTTVHDDINDRTFRFAAYQNKDMGGTPIGQWVISVNDLWFPGVYEDLDTAFRAACSLTPEQAEELQERVNKAHQQQMTVWEKENQARTGVELTVSDKEKLSALRVISQALLEEFFEEQREMIGKVEGYGEGQFTPESDVAVGADEASLAADEEAGRAMLRERGITLGGGNADLPDTMQGRYDLMFTVASGDSTRPPGINFRYDWLQRLAVERGGALEVYICMNCGDLITDMAKHWLRCWAPEEINAKAEAGENLTLKEWREG